MTEYKYAGPVMEFDRVIERCWKASTYAPTEKKARSNLAFQYKRDTKRAVTAKITLPGKLVVVKGD